MLNTFDRVVAWSPELHLAGLRLARPSTDELKMYLAADTSAKALRKQRYRNMGTTKRYFSQTVDLVSDALGYAVPMGIFFLTFMQWYYANEEQSGSSAVSLPIPPPPPPAPKVGVSAAHRIPGVAFFALPFARLNESYVSGPRSFTHTRAASWLCIRCTLNRVHWPP